MTTFLIVLVILGLAWIIALELRFHSLKNIVSESEQLAHDAADEADALLNKVRQHLDAEKPKSAKQRKR